MRHMYASFVTTRFQKVIRSHRREFVDCDESLASTQDGNIKLGNDTRTPIGGILLLYINAERSAERLSACIINLSASRFEAVNGDSRRVARSRCSISSHPS